jgi:hypothetical protein
MIKIYQRDLRNEYERVIKVLCCMISYRQKKKRHDFIVLLIFTKRQIFIVAMLITSTGFTIKVSWMGY